MAVQKSKKSKSILSIRRSHDSLSFQSLSTDKVTGEIHLRHNMTPDGYYKGRQVVVQEEEEEEES